MQLPVFSSPAWRRADRVHYILGDWRAGVRIFATGVAVVLVILTASPVLADPPFQGTVFVTPDIITSADPSAYTGATYTGRGSRLIFDYRPLEWITVNAYLFEARIHGRIIEFQVNPEFASVDAARAEVDTYALAIGRLPAVLLSRAENVYVNAGEPGHPDARERGRFGGRVPKVFGAVPDYGDFIIHTGSGQRYQRRGFLEEVLFHEGTHVSLQNQQDAPGWHAAGEADGEYISDYARRHPDSEDVAESLLPYFALRYRPNRLSSGDRAAIADTIPNRIAYFDALALDWSPFGGVSLTGGVKDLVDEGLDELNDDANGRQAAESVPALPAAGLLLLAILLGLLGRRHLRAG